MASDATFVTNIDLAKNELRNGKLHIVSADPSASASDEGWVIYQSTSKQFKFYNGSAWVTAGASVADLSNQAAAMGQGERLGTASTAARSDHYHALPAKSSIRLNELGTPNGNYAMGTYKLTGLAAGSANGDSVRYEQVVGVYLPLAGGTVTGDLNLTNASTVFKNAAGDPRFKVGLDGTENTGNTGSRLAFYSYNDSEVISTLPAMEIERNENKVTFTGPVKADWSTAQTLDLDGTGTTSAGIKLMSNNGNRWTIQKYVSETGSSDVGSDLQIIRHSDTGSALGTVVSIVRATGAITLGGTVAMGNRKITGLAAADSAGDALRYEQVVGVYAPLSSPGFSGTPTAPTAAVDTNTTQLATTAYVVGQGYLKSSGYTAADVLTKIKTVDGTGSGLDADLLDGNEASAFSLTGHTHSYLPLSGGTMTGTITMSNSATIAMGGAKITGLADGTAATDAVTKQQMDAAVTAAVAGLDVKQSVKYLADSLPGATYTATAGASGRGQLTNTPNTVDGVSVSVGDRILVTAVVGSNLYKACGIYTVTTVGTGSNGVWDRATDFDADAEVTANAFTFVESGGTYLDTGWVMVSSGTVVVGGASGTNIQWLPFSGPGTYQWGNGLAISGTEISVGAGAGVVADADAIRLNFTGGFVDPVNGSKTQYVARRHSVDLLDAAWTSTYYTVTHNLNTRDIVVSVREVAGSYGLVNAAVEADGVNTCRIYFATKPTTGTYRATVIA